MTDALGATTDRQVVEEYARGFACELDLIRTLVACSRGQCQAAGAHDLAALSLATLERQRAMGALVESERRLSPWRAMLTSPGTPAGSDAGLPPDIVAMHREARTLVAELAEHDARTRSSLDVLLANARADAQMVEAAEVTLAAYRRVVAPPPCAAELVDRRG